MRLTVFADASILLFALGLGFLATLPLTDAREQPQQVLHPGKATIPGRQGRSWRFDAEPHPNATHNYIFDTTASLLQQWPNTRYRNGHTLVPASVPAGTLLYHATTAKGLPQTPEWVALDPEHSFIYCSVFWRGQPCHLFTLAAKKTLKLLYFDGSSAAKIAGALDAQDILVWGKVIPDRTEDEQNRIVDLCRWGDKYGLDGFVRMSMDFEIMLCNFTSAAEQVSFIRLDVDPSEPIPGSEMTLPVFRTLEAGHWHNHFPGDTRVKLDLSRLISFYDAEMFPTLVEVRHGRERWDHRVEKLGEDHEGRERLLQKLDEVLGTEATRPSGSEVDWSTLLRVIVLRFADRLEVLRYTLNDTSVTKGTRALEDAHAYIVSMLSPYIASGVRPRSPPLQGTTTTTTSWAESVFRGCAETHTEFISALPPSRLTPSEHLILESIEHVLHEICRVIVGIWAEGVEIGIEAGQFQVLPQVDWELRIVKLMDWLDWSVWVKCSPGCEFEETCWLPTWPGFLWTRHDNGSFPDPDNDYWRRPQPECMRRVAPFKML